MNPSEMRASLHVLRPICYNLDSATRREIGKQRGESVMAQYHQPPATLNKAEWENLARAFTAPEQTRAFEKLRKANNTPQRAGDLFSPECVRSRGQEMVNLSLRKANSIFALSRIGYTNGKEGTPREDRLLAFVKRPANGA